MSQPSLFDTLVMQKPALRWDKRDVCANRHGGQQLKRRGMEKAAAKHSEELETVQSLARWLAIRMGEINIETVRNSYEARYGPWDLGNAAGSVFKGPEWECVGYREATRPEAHARIIRCWRLKK